jgi:DNA polymerase-3 subunit delta
VITLIHGPAELIRAEVLAESRAGITDDETLADLNTARFDGQHAMVAELENACDALPFLAERRLVIVEGLLRRLAASPKRPKVAESGESSEASEASENEESLPEVNKGQTKKLLVYLDHVPDSTELIFVESDTIGGGAILRRLLELQRDGRARVVVCLNPKRNELADWIRARARFCKVKLDASAVTDLADFIGDDLRQIDQELLKLADYAGKERTITRADVRQLVPATRAANIFELVDALGMGDAPSAGRLMQHALDADGEQPLRLLGMIARQYRLIIQAKALQAQGVKPPEIARELNVQEWTAPKLVSQANRHTFARLERAMERILAADEAIKTGKLTDREAMDVLFAELMIG